MVSRLLVIGGSIFALLGLVHALFCAIDMFRPTRLAPLDDDVRVAMKATSLRLSGERASMWDAWLGFNFSHSLGLVLFGGAAAWLGLNFGHIAITKSMLAIPVVAGLLYVLLAVRFWFYVAAVGVVVATACFAVAWWRY